MMSGLIRNSVNYRLALCVLLFSAFVTVILSVVRLSMDYQEYRRDIETQFDNIRDAHLTPLANTMWVYNEDLLNIDLKGILEMRDIVRLELTDDEGTVAAAGAAKGRVITRTYPLIYTYNQKALEIGRLTAVATLEGAYARMKSQITGVILFQGLTILLVTGFTLLIFQHLVTRHLRKIARGVRVFDAEAPFPEIVLNRKNAGEDELEQVKNAVNEMAASVRRSYEALRESEERYKMLSDVTLEGIAFHDNETILDANAAFAAMFGYAIDELAGMNITDVLAAPEDRDGVRERLLTGKESPYAAWSRNRAGGAFPTEIEARRVRRDGRSLSVVSVRDVTERRKTEAERERLIQELEFKNAELERFTYTVSHDLKSPIITIKGFLGMLEKDLAAGRADRAADDMRRISGAARKMHSLLEELLELSRIGRLENPYELIPFGDLVRESAEIVSGRLAEKNVSLRIDPDLPDVYGDPPRLREVLENLIDNAAKFMNDRADPEIRVGRRDMDGETVFFVADNGAGIDARYRDKVFGLFDKLEKDSDGSGVGLSIVKRIVEVHGGRIWLESDGPGNGATFYFTLPLEPEPIPQGDAS